MLAMKTQMEDVGQPIRDEQRETLHNPWDNCTFQILGDEIDTIEIEQ